LASVIFLAALFLTHSYGAWIALMLAVWLIGLSLKWKAWSLAGALVLYGAISGIGPLRRTIAPLTMAGTAGTGKAAPTDSVIPVKFEVRYGLWLAGAEAIKRAPVLGIGMNRLRLDPGIGYKNASAHNQFITTGAELGIPGLVAYIAVLVGVGWMAWAVWKRSRDLWMKAAALGLIAGQAAFHIFGLGDAIPLGSKPNVLFWVSLALITAIFRPVRAWPSGQCEEPSDEAIP
jgi:putative inorganic carbon (HCO3(-)) transporter